MSNAFQTKEFKQYFSTVYSDFKKQHKNLSKKQTAEYFMVLGIMVKSKMTGFPENLIEKEETKDGGKRDINADANKQQAEV